MLHPRSYLPRYDSHQNLTEQVYYIDPFAEPAAGEPGLSEYWRIIKKHRWLISAIFLTVLATVALLTMLMTRVFTAETLVLIEPRAPQVVDVKQVISEPQRVEEQNDFYTTQFEMLKSRSLAADVVRREQLVDHPLYQAKLADAAPGASAEELQRRATTLYLEKILNITPLKNSRLVKIETSTPDPELSARLANAHAQAFISQGLDIRTRASQDALEFLEGKLGELKQRVQTAEGALNAFRRERDVLSVDDKENITIHRLEDLNRRLTEAEVERIGLEAQVILIRKRAYDSVPAVVNNPLIQSLKTQLARLEADYANLGVQFTPEYPQMIQLKAQLDETRRRLDAEIRRVVGSIDSAFLSAEGKEKKLRGAMEQQKSDTFNLKDAAVQYAVLAREVESNRQLYDSVLQRIKEIGVAVELRASNVFVIDQAAAPLKPSQPKVLLYMGMAGLIGLAGALGAAFFKELFDNTIPTAKDVEHKLNLPNLASVPRFPNSDDRKLPPATGHNNLTTVERPFSAVAEAYGMLHTSIKFSRAGDAPKSILFTSGISGEGKTVTAVNTAIVCARMGARVVLLDADLRSPKCHEVLGAKRSPGLTEAITGQAELQNVTQPTSVRLLHFIPSGATPPTPPALLGSHKMQEILAQLSQNYDFVIIDSPPVMPVTDAVLLSTTVDGVILVVDSQATPHHLIKEAQSRLQYANAKVVGVVLNKIDVDNRDLNYYYPRAYSAEQGEAIVRVEG